MSTEDYVKIIDEKNKEIAELQLEVELLKKALASTHSLEELVIPDNSVTDDANITLKAPEEDDEPNEQPGNMMDIMSLMSMLMNASKGGEELDEDNEGLEADCEGEALDCEGEALDCEGEALDKSLDEALSE